MLRSLSFDWLQHPPKPISGIAFPLDDCNTKVKLFQGCYKILKKVVKIAKLFRIFLCVHWSWVLITWRLTSFQFPFLFTAKEEKVFLTCIAVLGITQNLCYDYFVITQREGVANDRS